MTDRSATSALFGFDFQANAAIVIMLENIKELNTIRLEGEEDIEIVLNDNTCILAQAKAVVESSTDFRNVLKNFRKSLQSLSDAGSSDLAVKEYIYITNSPNPFNEKQLNPIFYGTSQRYYDDLPKTLKDKVDKEISKITNPLNLSKYKIQILPFETDYDKERYKNVWESIREFISQLGISNISKEELHRIWKDEIFKSGTRKKRDLRLAKNEIIWPVIVLVTNNQNYDEEDLDESEIDEITRLYSNIVNTCSERYEFVTKILYAYNTYQTDKPQKERRRNFIKTQHQEFSYLFDNVILDTMDDVNEKLLQIIIRNVLNKRIQIENIKKTVNL